MGGKFLIPAPTSRGLHGSLILNLGEDIQSLMARGAIKLWKKLVVLAILVSVTFFLLHSVSLDFDHEGHKERALEPRSRVRRTQKIRRTDDDQQYLDLFNEEEMESAIRSHNYVHEHVEFGKPQCSCRGEEVRSNLFHKARNVTIIDTKSPKRRYHSNHWFHIGEHFLSAHQNRDLTSVVRAGDTILFVAKETKFVRDMTFMSAFLLLLALSPSEGCADGSIRRSRLEVYEPAFLFPQEAQTGKNVFWGSFAAYGPSIVLDMSKPAELQFERINLLENAPEEVAAGRQCHCGKLVSSVGAASVPSTEWFVKDTSAQEIKDKAHSLCLDYSSSSSSSSSSSAGAPPLQRPWASAATATSKSETEAGAETGTEGAVKGQNQKSLTLTVYERDVSRHFAQLGTMLEQLSGRISNRWTVNVIQHSESAHACELVTALRDTDAFLTTHGFQSTAVMFMPRGSVIIEIFPYKYFKPSYVPLASVFGVHHHWTQNTAPTSASRFWLRLVSQAVCMGINRCRSLARGDNVAMPLEHIDFVALVLSAKEKKGEESPY